VSPEVTSRIVTMKSDAEEDYQGWWKQTRDDPTMASGPWLPTTGAALALFVIESLLGFIATGFLIYAAAGRIAKGRRPRTPPDYSHLAP
jgi:hypothetical protein